MRGLLKTGDFSGRATRSEFWGFVPLGLVIPVAVAMFSPPAVAGLPTLCAKLAVIALATIPLASAATRRYRDAGAPTAELWVALTWTAMAGLALYLLAVGFFGIVTIVYAGAGMVLIAAALVLLVVVFDAPCKLGRMVSRLTRPSQPVPNRYGPPPEPIP